MKRSPRPSPAAAIALIAVMAALSPSAYGAARHLIGTKQLRNGAVTTSKLSTGAVTTPKLADGAVTGAKIAPGVIPAAPDLTGFASKGDSYTKAEADARFTPPKGLARTFFVSADGTAEENGDRLAAAIASLPKDNAAAALVLDAGHFDIGGRTLALRSNTTVRGAGRWSTMVRGTGTPFHVATGGVGVRLEDLAVFSSGVIAFDVDGAATIDAVDMRTNNASASVSTIDASNGSLHASDCTVAADAAVAFAIFAKSLTLDGCKLTAKGTQLAEGLALLTNGDGEILRSVIETTAVGQSGASARGLDIGPNATGRHRRHDGAQHRLWRGGVRRYGRQSHAPQQRDPRSRVQPRLDGQRGGARRVHPAPGEEARIRVLLHRALRPEQRAARLLVTVARGRPVRSGSAGSS